MDKRTWASETSSSSSPVWEPWANDLSIFFIDKGRIVTPFQDFGFILFWESNAPSCVYYLRHMGHTHEKACAGVNSFPVHWGRPRQLWGRILAIPGTSLLEHLLLKELTFIECLLYILGTVLGILHDLPFFMDRSNSFMRLPLRYILLFPFSRRGMESQNGWTTSQGHVAGE